MKTFSWIAAVVSVMGAEPRSFERVLLLEQEGATSASVSLGDLDRDGDLDIVLAKGRHWPLSDVLLFNDGKGGFSATKLNETADRTYSAALADLDGDGDLDIVASNDRPDKKLLYRNDGAGRFQLAGTFGDPLWSTRYVTLADLNGDKRPDILVANRSGDPAQPRPSQVCLNDGRGGFPVCTPLPTSSATIIVAADFDGDGAIDLLVPHRDGGQSLMFWNNGKAEFGKPAPFGPARSSIRAAAAGDLDGDGRLDVVTGDEKDGIFLFVNTGKRAFQDGVPLGGQRAAPYSLGIADMNRDGRADIVAGFQQAPGVVFFRQDGGAYAEAKWGDGKGTVYGLALGDLNGDGWPDIAAARTAAPNAVWWNGPVAGMR